MSKYTYAEEYFRVVDMAFFDDTLELEWRKPINSLEEKGVFFTICEWIDEYIPEEDDMESVYDNIHGWRENVKGGSFNPDENFDLYDPEGRLSLSDFILNGNCVFAEVTDNEYGVIGYIRLN